MREMTGRYDMFLKRYLRDYPAGFYASAGVAGASLILAVFYTVAYSASDEFSLVAAIMPAILIAGTFFLAALNLYEWIAAFQTVALLTGLGFYTYSMYYYVSVVFIGIDAQSFSAAFIITSLLYVLSTAAACVNVFLTNKKESDR